MGPGYLARDDRERPVLLTAPFDAVCVDENRVCLPVPFANQLRARLHGDTRRFPSVPSDGLNSAPEIMRSTDLDRAPNALS